MMKYWFLPCLVLLFLSACIQAPVIPDRVLEVDQIVSSDEPIVPGEPFPEFKTHFSTGTVAIYSYVWLKNSDTMTGSFPVRMRWFSPNDFRPPLAQQVVDLEPGQNVAQFSIHNENGMMPGPYMLLARTGRSLSDLTASGSARYFVNMTEEEATTFIEEETAYRIKRDEERAKREAERKIKEAEEARLKAESGMGSLSGTGSLGGTGDVLGGDFEGSSPESLLLEGDGEQMIPIDEGGLPPELMGGVGAKNY